MKDYKHPAVRAAKAHTSLCLFASVERMMENNVDSPFQADALAIIKRCKAAQQRCLAHYDAALAEIED